jgi:uncharacterized protein (DUF169 family)
MFSHRKRDVIKMSVSSFDYEEAHQKLDSILKLRGAPVGIKLLKKIEDLDKLNIQKPDSRLALCQLFGQARYMGRILGGALNEVDDCVLGSAVIGFAGLPEDIRDGTLWHKLGGYPNVEIAKKVAMAFHKLPVGSFASVVTAPLRDYSILGIDPDVVLLFGNPVQINLAIKAYHDANVGTTRVKSDYAGHATCEVIAAVIEKQKPWVSIPCDGARGLGAIQDDELIMGVTPKDLKIIIDSLDAARISYPPWSHYRILTMTTHIMRR